MLARAWLVVRGVLVLVLLPPLAPAQPSVPFTVSVVGDSTVRQGVDFLTARFYFNVTNTGSEVDYVTIPRSEIRWTSGDAGTALGVPTPEFGRALAPGATGGMWVRLDVREPRAGTYVASVPFKSERTSGTTTVSVTIVIDPAIERATAYMEGSVLSRSGAPLSDPEVEITEIYPGGKQYHPDVRPDGGFSLELPQARYAIRADADGYSGATRFVDTRGATDDVLGLDLRLSPLAVEAGPATPAHVQLDDSIWEFAVSRDFAGWATAPMTHSQPSDGRFYGGGGSASTWSLSFPAIAPNSPALAAGPFQANDNAISLSPDGSRAAAMDWNGKLHVVRTATGDVLWSTDRVEDANPLYPAGSVFRTGFTTAGATAFSPDGTLLAAGGSNGWLVVFDEDGDVRWTFATGGEIRALRFTPDGGRLAVGSGDWEFRMLDAGSGDELWSAHNEFWPFFFIAMDGEARRVGAGGKDGVFRFWDAADGELLWSKDYAHAFVSLASISDDGSRVVVSEWGHGVHGYDNDGDDLWFHAFSTPVAATTPDGRFVFVGTKNFGAGGPGGPTPETGDLFLLDGNGTILWEHSPDPSTTCTSSASPFPRNQIKSAFLDYVSADHSAVKALAACIGGGVFSVTIPIRAASAVEEEAEEEGDAEPPQPPLEDDANGNESSGTPKDRDGSRPTKPTATPGPAGAAGAFVAALVALWRRPNDRT